MTKSLSQEKQYIIKPIGYVENSVGAPLPAPEIREHESRIVVNPEFVDGLTGLAASEHVMVLFYFDRADEPEMLQHPRGDENRPKRGVFALRSPRRPNHIGVTEADIVVIQDNIIRVRGLDAINGTPIIDLKPA